MQKLQMVSERGPRTFSRSVVQSLPKLDDTYREPFEILKFLLPFLYSAFRSKVIRAYMLS